MSAPSPMLAGPPQSAAIMNAYIETRGYGHPDPACNAFRYLGEQCYRRVELADALEAALSPCG